MTQTQVVRLDRDDLSAFLDQGGQVSCCGPVEEVVSVLRAISALGFRMGSWYTENRIGTENYNKDLRWKYIFESGGEIHMRLYPYEDIPVLHWSEFSIESDEPEELTDLSDLYDWLKG